MLQPLHSWSRRQGRVCSLPGLWGRALLSPAGPHHTVDLINGNQLEELEVVVPRDAANARDGQRDKAVNKKGADRDQHRIHRYSGARFLLPGIGDDISRPVVGSQGARKRCQALEIYSAGSADPPIRSGFAYEIRPTALVLIEM
jgi:hypothetical protein